LPVARTRRARRHLDIDANDSLLQKVRPHCACAALHDLCRRECPCCGCRSTWRRFSRRRSPYAEPARTRVMCVTRGGQAGRGTGATGAMLSVGRQRAQTTAPSVQTAASTCAKPTWCARPSRRSLALPPKRRATGSVGVHRHAPFCMPTGRWLTVVVVAVSLARRRAETRDGVYRQPDRHDGGHGSGRGGVPHRMGQGLDDAVPAPASGTVLRCTPWQLVRAFGLCRDCAGSPRGRLSGRVRRTGRHPGELRG
jgi:hypothetical protein